MNIIITDVSGLSSLVIPIVPVNATIFDNGDVSEVDTLDGNINLIGNQKLRKASWSSTFPNAKTYTFIPFSAASSGFVYVAFIKSMKELRIPVRLIMTTNDNIPTVNMLASVQEFSYNMDKVGDINYSITLLEFPETFFGMIQTDVRLFNYVKDTKLINERRLVLEKWNLLKSKTKTFWNKNILRRK